MDENLFRYLADPLAAPSARPPMPTVEEEEENDRFLAGSLSSPPVTHRDNSSNRVSRPPRPSISMDEFREISLTPPPLGGEEAEMIRRPTTPEDFDVIDAEEGNESGDEHEDEDGDRISEGWKNMYAPWSEA